MTPGRMARTADKRGVGVAVPNETERRLAGVMLRAVREAGGVSRDQMAEECGVSPGTISNWESGRSIPARAHLKVWGELCEVPLADLYRIIGLSGDPLSLPDFWRSRMEAAAAADLPDNRRAGGPVRTVRGEVIRKDGAAGGGVIQSYPGPAVRELALASR
jgi:transcriptional regulator with XRE-family HTH domain